MSNLNKIIWINKLVTREIKSLRTKFFNIGESLKSKKHT